MFERKNDHQIPDRPLECSECKKPISVRYTEIVGDMITEIHMCADCPELQKRLHGTSPREFVAEQTGNPAGLECGNCGTTLEDVKRGHLLGCSICYTVFEDVLFTEMQTTNRLPPKMINKKGHPLHIGRSPGETSSVTLSSRLVALDEALKETLSREDYEQAALLRDQIKEITEKGEWKEKGTPKQKDEEKK